MDDIDLYNNWLKKIKNENKISYSKLGDIIGYSDVGISKAIKNKTLSINQILLIAEKLEVKAELKSYIDQNKFNLPISTIDKFNEITDDELSLYFLKNKERFLSNEVIKLWIDTLAIEKAKEILKNEILLKKKE